MFNFLSKIFDTNQGEVKKLQEMVTEINTHETKAKKLKDKDFPAQIAKIKIELNNGKNLDDVLPEVFALTREAGKRVLGMRAFDVQLLAAIALHQGNIAEQKTGEGKTLTAVFSVVL